MYKYYIDDQIGFKYMFEADNLPDVSNLREITKTEYEQE